MPEKNNWRKAVRDINTGPIGDPVNLPPVHDPEAKAKKKKEKQEQYGTGSSKKNNPKVVGSTSAV